MNKRPLKAIAGTPDKPLVIGGIEIPCYVLENESRVLTQSGMFASLKLARRGLVSVESGAQLPRFAASKSISPFISKELYCGLTNPILFNIGGGGARVAYGYPATILTDICDAVLKARQAGSLDHQQKPLAERCELLLRGFAHVGIIALVDEATGYQETRHKEALQALLEKYLLQEFKAWSKQFPNNFYKEMFRLKGWDWKGMKVNRPSVVGRYTNDIVYDRLEVGIREELEKRNPENAKGNRRSKHHQYLTDDLGVPALSQHLHTVIAFMRASSTWDKFKNSLNRALPKKGTTIEMELDEE